jgi:hypothetical protein
MAGLQRLPALQLTNPIRMTVTGLSMPTDG